MDQKISLQTSVYMDKLKGFRTHEINAEKLKCFDIPRDLIKYTKGQKNIEQPGIYFLINQEEGEEPTLYVGKTKNIHKRITDHRTATGKDYKKFNKVLAFVVDNNDLLMYIDYLEWHYIRELINGGAWKPINIQKRDEKPHMSDFNEPSLKQYISTIDKILFGINITFNSKKGVNKKVSVFNNNKAQAIYENEKLTILLDSVLPNVNNKIDNINKNLKEYSMLVGVIEKMLKQYSVWEEEGIVTKNNDGDYVVLRDIKLLAPTKASNYAKGTYGDTGWYDWKNNEGKTLDEVYRK